jgi:hypothetical protein
MNSHTVPVPKPQQFLTEVKLQWTQIELKLNSNPYPTTEPQSIPLVISSNLIAIYLKKFKLSYNRRSVCQSITVSGPNMEPMARFFSDNCGFIYIRRHLWREDRSVIYSYNSLPLSDLSPAEFMTTSYCLISDYFFFLLSPLTTRRATF